MQSRRRFLETVGMTAAAAGLSPLISQCGPQGRKLQEIGLQMSTIRKPLEEDWMGTLRRVAEIGYDFLEGGGPMGGMSIPDYQRFLDDLGLRYLSGGTSMAGLLDGLDALIAQSLEMGKEWVVCFWPWTDSREGKTLDDWKALTDTLNTIGRKVQSEGLRFAYHNHDLEFEITENRIPYDIILENTDPDSVHMQIDLYWIAKGGQEPIPYFEKFPGRFPLWHAKDMDATEERSFACVGEGILDFPAIFAKSDIAGMEYVFVEHDRPEDPIECIRVSHDYLANLRF